MGYYGVLLPSTRFPFFFISLLAFLLTLFSEIQHKLAVVSQEGFMSFALCFPLLLSFTPFMLILFLMFIGDFFSRKNRHCSMYASLLHEYVHFPEDISVYPCSIVLSFSNVLLCTAT